MSDSYKYADPDYTYTDPKTGILRNLADITDQEVLLFVESGAVTKRIQELHEKPFRIKGLTINLNPPDNKNIYDRYMEGTINSDLKTLTKLILELIEIQSDNKTGE